MAAESQTMNEAATVAIKPARIDRHRLDAAIFPAVIELPLRFDDLDVLWHVNNVAVITLLQEARVAFNRTMDLPALDRGLRSVVAAMTVEYAAEINFPGTVQVASGILEIGRSSFTFAQLVRHAGQSAIYSQVTMVVSGENGPAAIPDVLREALDKRARVRG